MLRLALWALLLATSVGNVAHAAPIKLPPHIPVDADGAVRLYCQLAYYDLKSNVRVTIDTRTGSATTAEGSRSSPAITLTLIAGGAVFVDAFSPNVAHRYELDWAEPRLVRKITAPGQNIPQAGRCEFIQPKPAAPLAAPITEHPAKSAGKEPSERISFSQNPSFSKSYIQAEFARAVASNPADTMMPQTKEIIPATYSATGNGCVTTVKRTSLYTKLSGRRYAPETSIDIVIDWSQVRSIKLSRQPVTNFPDLIFVLLDTPAIPQDISMFPAGTENQARSLRDKLNLLVAACR